MLDRVYLPDYERVNDSVSPHNPSELHGLLCGLLCLDQTLTSDAWLAQVDEHGFGRRDRDSLDALFDVTRRQISDDDYSFMLLLPDDDMNLSVRAESLGNWCQGFLAGLSLAGYQNGVAAMLSAETREFLDDISHIARVGFDGESADEDDEIAYAEIVEYLRMGVLVVNQELVATARRRPQSSSVH